MSHKDGGPLVILFLKEHMHTWADMFIHLHALTYEMLEESKILQVTAITANLVKICTIFSRFLSDKPSKDGHWSSL
jgi:hypothetical protein